MAPSLAGVECSRLTWNRRSRKSENSKGVGIRFSEEDVQLMEGIELGRTISDVGKGRNKKLSFNAKGR